MSGRGGGYLSFADPDTHYELVTYDHSEHNADGPLQGKPTGEVRCLGTTADGSVCGGIHTNVDDIPHEATCDQRFAHSRYYIEMLDGRCGRNPRAVTDGPQAATGD